MTHAPRCSKLDLNNDHDCDCAGRSELIIGHHETRDMLTLVIGDGAQVLDSDTNAWFLFRVLHAVVMGELQTDRDSPPTARMQQINPGLETETTLAPEFCP